MLGNKSTYFHKSPESLAKRMAETLANHPYQDDNDVYIVRATLSMEVPRASGGTTTVLNGILEELV